MNAEKINARYKELCEMEEKLKADIGRLQADLIAVNGAKQDCQFWLNEVAKSVVGELNVPDAAEVTGGLIEAGINDAPVNADEFEDTTKMTDTE